MRNLLTIVLLLLWGSMSALGQENSLSIEPNEKFGKPTAEEWALTTYAPDPDAEAVVLYSHTTTAFDFTGGEIRLVYSYKKRIKVLKEKGMEFANMVIPFYEEEGDKSHIERVDRLSATSFNQEGKKVVRTKMKKEQVFEERVNAHYKQVKFTVPQVKVGTIIEYEYELYSDFFYSVRTWTAQEDVPTLYTEYHFSTPEYFRFHIERHGFEPLETSQKVANFAFMLQESPMQCTGMSYSFVGRNMPAMKDEGLIYYPDDYYTQVNTELLSVDIPGAGFHNYTQTWEQIDKVLLESDGFGKLLKQYCPLQKEMEKLPLAQAKSLEEKVAMIYALLKSHVQWNGKYALEGRPARQVLDEKSGDNADLNFLLLNMLRDAGIEAHPAVMSRRNRPMLLQQFPSLQGLNTFVVAIIAPGDKILYLDTSVSSGALNVLPPVLLTSLARIITPQSGRWVNLQDICRNSVRSSINATLSPEGIISGTRTTRYEGQPASDLRAEYLHAKDSTEFTNRLGNIHGVEIKRYEAKNLKAFQPDIQESLDFTKPATVNDAYIYVNPLIFLHQKESPFKQAVRRMPVEFAHTEQVEYIVNLNLPEGYSVEELPQAGKLNFFGGNLTMTYNIIHQENRISLRYMFHLKTLFHAPDNYPDLKNFWEKVAETNNAMVVLKKNS